MIDDVQDEAPELTVERRSFMRGTLGGKPCLVIFDDETEETTVIGPQSKWYANAMAALDIIEAASTKLPPPPKPSVIQMPPKGIVRAN